MGRPKKDESQSDQQMRRLVLLSAAQLFGSKGYAATTVREIVSTAGVSKPVLYYYFGSKEGVYLELVRRPFERLKALVEGFTASEGSIRDRVGNLFDEVFSLFSENVEAARMMYTVYYGPSQGAPSFDFEPYHRAFYGALRRLLAQGAERGEWCSEWIEDAVWAILGALGVAVEVRLSHPDAPIGREGLSRMLTLIFTGMSALSEKESAC